MIELESDNFLLCISCDISLVVRHNSTWRDPCDVHDRKLAYSNSLFLSLNNASSHRLDFDNLLDFLDEH